MYDEPEILTFWTFCRPQKVFVQNLLGSLLFRRWPLWNFITPKPSKTGAKDAEKIGYWKIFEAAGHFSTWSVYLLSQSCSRFQPIYLSLAAASDGNLNSISHKYERALPRTIPLIERTGSTQKQIQKLRSNFGCIFYLYVYEKLFDANQVQTGRQETNSSVYLSSIVNVAVQGFTSQREVDLHLVFTYSTNAFTTVNSRVRLLDLRRKAIKAGSWFGLFL